MSRLIARIACLCCLCRSHAGRDQVTDFAAGWQYKKPQPSYKIACNKMTIALPVCRIPLGARAILLQILL